MHTKTLNTIYTLRIQFKTAYMPELARTVCIMTVATITIVMIVMIEKGFELDSKCIYSV